MGTAVDIQVLVSFFDLAASQVSRPAVDRPTPSGKIGPKHRASRDKDTKKEGSLVNDLVKHTIVIYVRQ